jgi:hypothetical protein
MKVHLANQIVETVGTLLSALDVCTGPDFRSKLKRRGIVSDRYTTHLLV